MLRIYSAFSLSDTDLMCVCFSVCPSELKMAAKQIVLQQTDEERAAAAVALIDDRLERMTVLGSYEKSRGNLEEDAEARSFSLPPVDATDKLLRYEAHLDRQLYRAMDQLERLQRQRRGENVPPPLDINLGRRR
jgi:CRISPR/Cas system-associated endonuclease Cas1